MTTPAPAYRVEVYNDGCKTCGHGKQWWIVGPGDVGGGKSYGDEVEAFEDCEALNGAYLAGTRVGRGRVTTARPPDTIGARILAARLAANHTQRSLGDLLGVAASSISDWEHDKSVMPLDRFVMLATVLNVAPAALIPEGIFNGLKPVAEIIKPIVERATRT